MLILVFFKLLQTFNVPFQQQVRMLSPMKQTRLLFSTITDKFCKKFLFYFLIYLQL